MDNSDDSESVEADGCIVSKTVNYINIGHVDNLQNAPPTDKLRSLSSPMPTSLPEKSSTFGALFKLGRKVFGDTTRGLKSKLKNFYSEATLPCVSWLDQGRDLLLSDYYVRLQLANNSTSLPLEDIFRTSSGVNPTRILIEGQPGFGKTTLATKIVFDWATEQKYLKLFKLAFLMPLRELRRRSVKSAMEDISRLSGFSDYGSTGKIIEDNMSKTLLVLDGLDELPIKERREVLQILFKQVYREMTVLVTCRTGLFNMDECELNELFGGVSKKKVFCDKRIVVAGVGIEDREKFLSKFVSEKNAKDVLRDLEELTFTISDIFQSPLFLILLSMLIVKKKEKLKLTTRTLLYKTLVNCIIRRSVGKTGVDLGENFDIFGDDDLEESTENFKKAFYHFGIVCFDKVMSSDLQFECNELTSTIYEMGFLVNHKNVTFFESNQHFEAFHMSIIEFAAAFALSTEIRIENDTLDRRTSEKIINKITSIHCQNSSTSLILPFLFGLIGKKSAIVLEKLQPIAHLFSVTENTFWSILAECTIDKHFLSAITQYIPLQIRHSEYKQSSILQPPIHEDVLRHGIASKQITNIWTSTNRPTSLPKDVVIPHLAITVDVEEDLEKYNISQLENLKCKQLSLTLQNLFNFNDDDLVLKYINLFCKIPAKQRSLSLTWCHNDAVIIKNINTTQLQDLKLSTLAIALNRPNSTSEELLLTLLKRNQIKSLDLFITPDSSTNDYTQILHHLVDSEYLEELNLGTVPNFLFEIDLYLLTNGGKKKWKLLMLRFLRICCSKPITNKNCIERLITKTNNFETATAINDLELQVLECNNVVLCDMVQNVTSSWHSFDTLLELIILLDGSSKNKDFWDALTNLKCLKLLEIILPVKGWLNRIPINNILNCLQAIPIERFVVWRACRPELFGFTKKLIRQMISSFPWRLNSNRHPLSTLDLGLFLTIDQEVGSDLGLFISEILESVKLRYLDSLNIIVNDTSFWYLLMQDNVIDYSVFKVVHSLPGVNENDPAYHKIWCDNFCSRDANQFCISLR